MAGLEFDSHVGSGLQTRSQLMLVFDLPRGTTEP